MPFKIEHSQSDNEDIHVFVSDEKGLKVAYVGLILDVKKSPNFPKVQMYLGRELEELLEAFNKKNSDEEGKDGGSRETERTT